MIISGSTKVPGLQSMLCISDCLFRRLFLCSTLGPRNLVYHFPENFTRSSLKGFQLLLPFSSVDTVYHQHQSRESLVLRTQYSALQRFFRCQCVVIM